MSSCGVHFLGTPSVCLTIPGDGGGGVEHRTLELRKHPCVQSKLVGCESLQTISLLMAASRRLPDDRAAIMSLSWGLAAQLSVIKYGRIM